MDKTFCLPLLPTISPGFILPGPPEIINKNIYPEDFIDEGQMDLLLLLFFLL